MHVINTAHTFKAAFAVKRRHHIRRISALGLAAVLGLSLAACAPGGQATTDSAKGPISTSVPSDKKVTITLSHWEVGGNATAINTLISNYEKKHPNITIKTSFTSFNDYGKRIKLSMSSASAPDIAQVGQAYVMMGPLVKAGLLRPIDDYSKAYGWEKRFGAGLLDQARFVKDASSFGTGDLYGLALGGNMVGLYYNKATLSALGITVPLKDMAALDDALAKVKASGQIPIELGNSEQWPGNHVLSSLIAQNESQSDLLNWIYGKKGATFSTAGVKKSADTMSEWATKGYIDPAANGINNDDAIARFAGGTGAFFISGNWSLATLSEKMGDKAGFIAFPPAKAGDPARATGATTSPFAISSKSKYPDIAANFIDYMNQPAQAEILSSNGYAPLLPTGTEVAGASGLQKDFDGVWGKVIKDDGLDLFLDWSTTSMGNTLFPAIQEMIAGKTTPDQLIENVQSEWTKSRA